MWLASGLALHLERGVWAPLTVGFVWEAGLAASLRLSGLRLQGAGVGVLFGCASFSVGGLVPAGTPRNAVLLLLFGGWAGLCCFVKQAATMNTADAEADDGELGVAGCKQVLKAFRKAAAAKFAGKTWDEH